MALRLVIGACSNEHVASWALQWMGDDLVTQTRREAACQGNLRDASLPGSFATLSGLRTLRPARTLLDPYADPISLCWRDSALYSATVRRGGPGPGESGEAGLIRIAITSAAFEAISTTPAPSAIREIEFLRRPRRKDAWGLIRPLSVVSPDP